MLFQRGCLLTRASRRTLPVGENQLPDTDLLSHAHLASEAVETRFCRCGFWGGVLGGFFGGYPNQKWLQLPGLGREGSGTPQAQGKLVGTKRKQRNLPPNRWILTGSSSLPILPEKPKGVRLLLAQNLGLTASAELCKASSWL